MVLDRKNQEMTLHHPVISHELYADLSLPGLWPEFRLKASTAWAPDWRSGVDAGATMNTSVESSKRLCSRPLRSMGHRLWMALCAAHRRRNSARQKREFALLIIDITWGFALIGTRAISGWVRTNTRNTSSANP